MRSTKPTIFDLDMHRLDDVLQRAEEALPEEDYAILKAVVESYAYLADLVGDKNTSITRLRKLLFGAKTEKTAPVGAKVYYLQKLRCGLCGVVFTAEPPGDVGEARSAATCWRRSVWSTTTTPWRGSKTSHQKHA